MTAQEIIAELPKLNRLELEQVGFKLHELLFELATSTLPRQELKRFAGVIRGLPPDMARNHDHYFHGRLKK